MSFAKSESLEAFDSQLTSANMRGQWASDDARDKGQGGAWQGPIWETAPRGKPHQWCWKQTERLLEHSCDTITESFTARRSLIFHSPGLPRSTTHTMNVGIQIIKPGEIAWAHRHSISALRFVIEGHHDLFTVVNGEPCQMNTHDLVLTPNGYWHDHHNTSPSRAIWLDVLDGPLVSALNQTVFENLGEQCQTVNDQPKSGDMHFPWAEMEDRISRVSTSAISDFDGYIIPYTSDDKPGPVLPTIGAAISVLPPGYAGAPHRHSSSTVYLAIGGSGRSVVGDQSFDWQERDVFVVPAWVPHKHANASREEEARLFAVTDAPALEALGLHKII